MIDIPQYKNWAKVEPLGKGWSNDKKYYVETTGGERLLLRLSAIPEYDKKKAEFEAIKTISKLDIPMSMPVDFGVCNEGTQVYMLLTWIDGEDAEKALPTLNEKEKYELGVEAGKILRKIHSIDAPANQKDWEKRIRKKVAKKLEEYKVCKYKLPHDSEILSFIEDNLKYLENRPQKMLHGDFHVGNLIIDANKKLGIIDFNRWDYGDPYEEFNRLMVFSRRISIPFAKGQIDGYFDGEEIPEIFFRMMALYTAINAHFSIIWSIPFGEEEIKGDLERSQMNYEDYDGFTNIVPKWYGIST